MSSLVVSVYSFGFGSLSFYVKRDCLGDTRSAHNTNTLKTRNICTHDILVYLFSKNSGGGGGGGGDAAGGVAEEAVEEVKEEEEMDLGGGMDMFGGEEAGGGDY
jgi:hypothetical protein